MENLAIVVPQLNNTSNMKARRRKYHLENIADNSEEEDIVVDDRIKYWDTISPWDTNYSLFLYGNDDIYTQDYFSDYKSDTIDGMHVSTHPISELIHNRIVELIPLGIHNIWFRITEQLESTDKCYSDFGEGIKVDDISKMITYCDIFNGCLGLECVNIKAVWSEEDRRFFDCFKFRGFISKENRKFKDSLKKENTPTPIDITDIYPEYYSRVKTFSYPFSKEQRVLRKEFNDRVAHYFSSGKYLARTFNDLQEKPITKYINEYIEFEEVRHAFSETYNRYTGQQFRTYFLSFHMKKECWLQRIKTVKKYYHNDANISKHQIWTIQNTFESDSDEDSNQFIKKIKWDASAESDSIGRVLLIEDNSNLKRQENMRYSINDNEQSRVETMSTNLYQQYLNPEF